MLTKKFALAFGIAVVFPAKGQAWGERVMSQSPTPNPKPSPPKPTPPTPMPP